MANVRLKFPRLGGFLCCSCFRLQLQALRELTVLECEWKKYFLNFLGSSLWLDSQPKWMMWTFAWKLALTNPKEICLDFFLHFFGCCFIFSFWKHRGCTSVFQLCAEWSPCCTVVLVGEGMETVNSVFLRQITLFAGEKLLSHALLIGP